MLFYTINNLLILVWAAIFCWHKPSKVKNLIFVIVAFAQLFAVMVFRHGIGYDYNMYAVGYNFMTQDGFSNLTYKDWEIGFVLLTKVLGMFLPNYMWYMGIFSLVAIIPAAIFIYRDSEIPWLSTVLYINLFVFFMSMNFIRQMIAISFVMLAWHFLKRNKFIPYAIIILLASLFHQTVLIMIPVYLLVKMKPNFKELIVYAYLLLWFYISSTGFIEIITTFFHEEYSGSAFLTEGLSFVYVILPLFVTVAAFLLVKAGTINVTNENKYLINLSLIATLMMLTMARHSIIERLSYYFLFFIVLLVPLIYRSLRTKGISYTISETKSINLTTDRQKFALALVFVLIVLALSYFHFYYGLTEKAHGVVPYDTWLRTSWSGLLSN